MIEATASETAAMPGRLLAGMDTRRPALFLVSRGFGNGVEAPSEPRSALIWMPGPTTGPVTAGATDGGTRGPERSG